jgi:hypothetical protein
MLQHFAEWFYDPVVFWGVPLVLVAVRAAVLKIVSRLRPPG